MADTGNKNESKKVKLPHDRVGEFIGDIDERLIEQYPLEEVMRIGIDPKWADLIGE